MVEEGTGRDTILGNMLLSLHSGINKAGQLARQFYFKVSLSYVYPFALYPLGYSELEGVDPKRKAFLLQGSEPAMATFLKTF